MRRRINYILAAVTMVVAVASCSTPSKTAKTAIAPQPKVVNLDLTASPRTNAYINLDYGIRTNFKDMRPSSSREILFKHDSYVTSKPVVSVNPDILSFVQESMRRYMRAMGFRLDSDLSSDYLLTVSINSFNVSFLDGIGWSAVVNMDIAVYTMITSRFTRLFQLVDAPRHKAAAATIR